MMTSLPAVATVLPGIALLVFAVLRWRENGWGALVWLAVFAAMMRPRFGDAWDAYCAHAGRLFPRRIL
jgi:hypothetical protein